MQVGPGESLDGSQKALEGPERLRFFELEVTMMIHCSREAGTTSSIENEFNSVII